jgi:hypothetical protein
MREAKFEAEREAGREAVFGLIREAEKTKCWIVRDKNWYTPTEFLEMANAYPDFIIRYDSNYRLADPRKALEQSGFILNRLRKERQILIDRINEYRARGR